MTVAEIAVSVIPSGGLVSFFYLDISAGSFGVGCSSGRYGVFRSFESLSKVLDSADRTLLEFRARPDTACLRLV